MDDPYDILGVSRKASEKEIRAAYRKLAKAHHPDVNPGKPEAAERFKTIATAYDLLSDPEKRARFDRGEIDASGAEKPPERPYWRDFAEQPGGAYQSATGFNPEDLEELLAHTFGQRGSTRGSARGFSARGPDARYSLTVSFIDATRGATRRINLPSGRTLDVTIPPGTRDGVVLRLKGMGSPGMGDGPPGDALVEIGVVPHAFFRREGDDILLELPVSLQEAVLGAVVEVPTISGPVKLTIPPASGTGTRLRLRGRGVGGGSQIVELRPVLPAQAEPELAAFLKDWKPQHRVDPRSGLEEG